jgi:hypothetical protein
MEWFKEDENENETHFEEFMYECKDKNNQILSIMDDQITQFKNYSTRCKNKIDLLQHKVEFLERQKNHTNRVLKELFEKYKIDELNELIYDSDTSDEESE